MAPQKRNFDVDSFQARSEYRPVLAAHGFGVPSTQKRTASERRDRGAARERGVVSGRLTVRTREGLPARLGRGVQRPSGAGLRAVCLPALRAARLGPRDADGRSVGGRHPSPTSERGQKRRRLGRTGGRTGGATRPPSRERLHLPFSLPEPACYGVKRDLPVAQKTSRKLSPCVGGRTRDKFPGNAPRGPHYGAVRRPSLGHKSRENNGESSASGVGLPFTPAPPPPGCRAPNFFF